MHNNSNIVFAMALIASGPTAAVTADNSTAPAPVTISTPVVGALPATNEDLIEQLQNYDRILLSNPNDAEARVGRWRSLSRLGATDIAIAEAERRPGTAPDILRQLHEDKVDLMLRWNQNTYYDKPSDEYPGTDQIIAQAQENLQRFPDSLRLRYALVRAYNDRKRRDDAIAIYTALPAPASEIPAEVHESAGAAYLAQKHPELAEQALRRALANQPDNFKANIGLFYALVEQNNFAAARAQIHALATQPLPPDQQLSAATIAALDDAFEGRFDLAQSQLTQFIDEAPASDQLHLTLGKIYFWRGWPRRARAQFQLIAQNDIDNLQANTSLVETDAALGNFVAADARLAQLQVLNADEFDVKAQTRAQALREANELTIGVSGTRSSENIATGRGVIVESKFLAKSFWPQTRPFIHEYFERAITDNVHADYRRLGAGLQYTMPNWGTVEGEVQQEFYLNPKTSAAVSTAISLDDHWSVNGRLDSNSIEVPLVARYYGVGGWLVSAGLAYRDSERWELSSDLSQLDMNDDNTRRAILLRGSAQVMRLPSYQGSLGLEWYHATNSRTDVPYYSPSNTSSLLLSYVSDWNTYQRYERSFGQRLTLSIGRQTESGFSAATIGGVSYEHRLSLSDTVALDYGIGYIRRVYSGGVSSGPEVHLNLNWKFL